MKKEELGGIGAAVVTLMIFAYGLKSGRGWKYWLFSMLFITSAGYAIGYGIGGAIGLESNLDKLLNDYEKKN